MLMRKMLDHVKVCGQDTPSKADTSAETGGDGERTGGDMVHTFVFALLTLTTVYAPRLRSRLAHI